MWPGEGLHLDHVVEATGRVTLDRVRVRQKRFYSPCLGDEHESGAYNSTDSTARVG